MNEKLDFKQRVDEFKKGVEELLDIYGLKLFGRFGDEESFIGLKDVRNNEYKDYNFIECNEWDGCWFHGAHGGKKEIPMS